MLALRTGQSSACDEQGVWNHLHASHAQDGYQHEFSIPCHVEIPHHKNGQQPKREITDCRNSTVQKRQPNDNIDVDACPALHLPKPEERNGRALEKCNKEEDGSGQRGKAHDDKYDSAVNRVHGNAEEEEPDGDLGRDHGKAVGDVAEPPVSEGFVRLLVGKVTGVAAGAVVDATDGTRREHDVSAL